VRATLEFLTDGRRLGRRLGYAGPRPAEVLRNDVCFTGLARAGAARQAIPVPGAGAVRRA
jgi:hypothetical protein